MSSITKSVTKSKVKSRAVLVSGLAAQLLGRTRVANEALTARYLSTAFPAFNSQELENAIAELVEKQLLQQKGSDGRATYMLTDSGRESRVGVA